MRTHILLAVALALPLIACGDDGDGLSLECQSDEATTGSVITGTDFKVKILEAPATVNPELELDYAVQILDADDTPLDGITLASEEWQPVHMHGVPLDIQVTPRGSNGEYDLAKVYFLHPGRWELRFTVGDGTTEETVTAYICVAGTPPPP